MHSQITDLLRRYGLARQIGQSLLDRRLQLIAARGRLHDQNVEVLEEFTSLARTFYDGVVVHFERDGSG